MPESTSDSTFLGIEVVRNTLSELWSSLNYNELGATASIQRIKDLISEWEKPELEETESPAPSASTISSYGADGTVGVSELLQIRRLDTDCST